MKSAVLRQIIFIAFGTRNIVQYLAIPVLQGKRGDSFTLLIYHDTGTTLYTAAIS